MDYVRIGTVSDPVIDANLVELQKVIADLNNKIAVLQAQVKALGGK